MREKLAARKANCEGCLWGFTLNSDEYLQPMGTAGLASCGEGDVKGGVGHGLKDGLENGVDESVSGGVEG